MRPLRWVGLAALGVLLAAAAGLVVLKRRFPPERIRDLALAKLEPAIGRRIRVQSVELMWRGVVVRGLEVSEAPDFAAGVFIKAEELTAGWSLRALLERRLAISTVRLSGFECRLAQDAQGRLNASSLGAASAGGAPKKPGRGAPAAGAAAVSVSRILVERGTVSYRDAAGAKAQLSDVALELEGLRPGSALPLSLSFDYSYSRPGSRYAGKLAFTGSVKTGKGAAAELTFKPLKGSVAGAPFKLLGRARIGAAGALEADLEPLELEHAGLKLRIEGKVARAADGKIQASARTKLPALTGADLKRLAAGAPAGLALPAGTAEVALSYADGLLRLEPAVLAFGSSRIEARGSARVPEGKGSPALDMTIRADALPLETLAPLAPALAAYGVSGKATLDLRVSGTAAAPSLSGKAKLAALAASASGLALTAGDLDAAFTPKNAKAELKGRLSGAELSLTVDAKDYGGAPDIRVDGRLSSLDLGAWTASRSKDGPEEGKPASNGTAAETEGKTFKTSGKVRLGPIRHPNFQAESAALEWSLGGIAPGFEKLGGKASLKIGAGKFEDLKLLAAKSQVAKVALLPLVVLQRTAGLVKLPLFPAFDKVAFSEITGNYAFANGVMTVKESHMDSSAGYVTTTGTADLARDKLDLRIAAKIGGALRGTISGPLAFYVRGTLASPEVKPDVTAIIKQPGVEQVLDQGKKLLEGIFK